MSADDGTAVGEVVVRYATAIDTRDWDLFRTCFTEDCRAEYGATGSWNDLDSFARFMEEIHARCGRSLHRLTNVVVHVDGDEARSRSYVDAVVLGPDNNTGTRAAGYYDDRFVRTGAGWRIRERQFEMVHLSLDIGPNAAV
jgi:3-phenylpropionate/cinnamic acid dioxygenase small subunit